MYSLSNSLLTCIVILRVNIFVSFLYCECECDLLSWLMPCHSMWYIGHRRAFLSLFMFMHETLSLCILLRIFLKENYAAKTAGLTSAVFETELFVFSLFMALLFGRIRIHYSAYYSGQIEYEYNIRYSPKSFPCFFSVCFSQWLCDEHCSVCYAVMSLFVWCLSKPTHFVSFQLVHHWFLVSLANVHYCIVLIRSKHLQLYQCMCVCVAVCEECVVRPWIQLRRQVTARTVTMMLHYAENASLGTVKCLV